MCEEKSLDLLEIRIKENHKFVEIFPTGNKLSLLMFLYCIEF